MVRYKRRVKWVCGWMLGLSITLRVVVLGWGSLMPSAEQVLSGLFLLEIGAVGSFEAQEVYDFAPLIMQEVEIGLAEVDVPTEIPVIAEPEIETTESTPMTYTQAQADAIELNGAGTFPGDIFSLLSQDLDLNFSGEAPTVLILHSHTSESYAQAVGWEYVETDTARTQDSTFNIVRVGDMVAEILEDGGVTVIHDETVHDFPDYNSSYWNALDSIEFWLEKYPSITMVIDIHRDAAVDGDGLPIAYTTTIDGEDTAQMMLVVGTDQGGLSHPNWTENLSFALKLQTVFNETWPGYARPINLRTERFNQHATPASILVEIGSHGNTLEEALASAEIFATGLLELLMQYQG